MQVVPKQYGIMGVNTICYMQELGWGKLKLSKDVSLYTVCGKINEPYHFLFKCAIQSIPFTTTVFVPKKFDLKLNFCCNELKFKLYWYICANTTDVVKNFDE